MQILSTILVAAFILTIIYEMGHDMLARTIPDIANFLLLIIGLTHRIMIGQVVTSAEWTLIWVFIMFGLYGAGVLGGGDAKMMVGISFMMPTSPIFQLYFAVVVALIGGLIAISYILTHYIFKWLKISSKPTTRKNNLWQRWKASETWRINRLGGIPYGIALGFGILSILV